MKFRIIFDLLSFLVSGSAIPGRSGLAAASAVRMRGVIPMEALVKSKKPHADTAHLLRCDI